MKFRKSGQILLALAVSLVLGFGVTSCSKDYTVAYLYVTGAQYNQIGGMRVDNDNGSLKTISGQPWGSGGTNPTRVLVYSGSKFVYVLNAGTATTSTDTSSLGNISYNGANIAVFSVGGYGQLAQQQTYTSQGFGPVRISSDSSGKYLYVLDQYAPNGNNPSAVVASVNPTDTNPCKDSANGLYYPYGDITVFTVDSNTGRLALVPNNQSANGASQLNYFPVGCFPVDFHASSSYIHTVNAGATTNTDLSTAVAAQNVSVYAINSSSGQLTLTQNAPLPTAAANIVAINADAANKYIYILDAGSTSTSPGQILPYTIGTSGALTLISGGGKANDPNVAAPTSLTTDSKSTFLYVANSAGTSSTNGFGSSISIFHIDTSTGVLQEISGSPKGTGSGPRCILEDPSNQYFYTANYNDSTITGQLLQPAAGTISDLTRGSTFSTVGQPTWCTAVSRN